MARIRCGQLSLWALLVMLSVISTACSALPSIGTVKKDVQDSSSVSLTGVCVTASFVSPSCIYVEAPDRSSGIRVNTSQTFMVGTMVDVEGIIYTDPDTSERYIVATPTYPRATRAAECPTPVGLKISDVGGGDFGYQAGVTGGRGVNNIGLLVKVWGKVTTTGPNWFSIVDGSGVELNVVCPTLYPPPVARDNYYSVTGISSCEKWLGNVLRLLIVRDQDDIVPMTQN